MSVRSHFTHLRVGHYPALALMLALFLALIDVRTAHAQRRGGFFDPAAWPEWHGEPWLWIVLLGSSAIYARGVQLVWQHSGHGRGIMRYQATAYTLGMATLFIALLSPLASLAHQKFALHMVQHMLLIMVAAPLMVLGAPHLAYLWAMPLAWRRGLARQWQRARWLRKVWAVVTLPVSVWVLHTAALWIWHVPNFYESALRNQWIHHLEHLSFFASSLLFWWLLTQVGVRGPVGYGVALIYIFTTMIQGALLGALLTFSPIAWYPTQTQFGQMLGMLTPLEDQQLAGVIMWVPGGPIYLACFLWLTARWLRASDTEAQRTRHPIWAEMRQSTLDGD